MKNKLFLLIIAIITTGKVYGQYFEGKVVYDIHFTSKMKNLADEQLGILIGTQQEYFIKGGNYKTTLNGRSVVMQLYDYKTNHLYNQKYNLDTLYWFDASKNTDEAKSFEIKLNAALILGNKCDAIIMQTRTGTTTIYYTTRYKVDSKAYINHNYGNWAFYLSKTGALPLKTVIENNQFRMESIAVAITPLTLDQELFYISERTPTKSSAY